MCNKCFGDKKQNKIMFYINLGVSYDLAKTLMSKICRGCRYYDDCCKKIISGNGFEGLKKSGRRRKKEFVGYAKRKKDMQYDKY